MWRDMLLIKHDVIQFLIILTTNCNTQQQNYNEYAMDISDIQQAMNYIKASERVEALRLSGFKDELFNACFIGQTRKIKGAKYT